MMELPGKRKLGRPKRRFMDLVEKDSDRIRIRNNWRRKIRCGEEEEGICLLYHGILPPLRSYAKWFHSYVNMKMTKDIFLIYEIPRLMCTK